MQKYISRVLKDVFLMKHKLSTASCIFVRSFNFAFSIKFVSIKKRKNMLTLMVEGVQSSGKKTKYFQIVLDNCMEIRG